MDTKNKNISDTFGKYNNSVGEVKNVSSSMWEPISAGKSTADKNPVQKKSQPQKSTKAPAKSGKSGEKSNAKAKKPSAAKKSDKTRNTLISEGNPASKKKAPAKKQAQTSTKTSKSTKSKKAPPSRTPTGRDLRKDARENQKHREELSRFREDYRKQINNQLNHDEISQLRNKNKRKKQLRKNAVTVGSVVFFALLFIFLYCYSRGALIENIIIDGSSIYSSQEIQQAAGISVGRNMLSLREKKVRRDITSKLPYIKDVTVDYDLPDTLILTVKGTSDKYVIACQSGYLTLDGDGKVVSLAKEKLESGVFRADGFDFQSFESGDTYKPEGINEQRFELLKRIVTLFEKNEIVDTAVINLQNPADVTVTVDEKIRVYFGDCRELEEKVPYASGIIAQVRETGKKGYIDMRFDLGYFKPGSMTIS